MSRRLLVILVGVAPLVAMASPPEVLTNASVIRLVQAGLAEPVIIAKIRSSTPAFDLSTDSLIALKAAGVPDNVMATMLAATAAPPQPSAPASPFPPNAPKEWPP
jgi:hypothetical protein